MPKSVGLTGEKGDWPAGCMGWEGSYDILKIL